MRCSSATNGLTKTPGGSATEPEYGTDCVLGTKANFHRDFLHLSDSYNLSPPLFHPLPKQEVGKKKGRSQKNEESKKTKKEFPSHLHHYCVTAAAASQEERRAHCIIAFPATTGATKSHLVLCLFLSTQSTFAPFLAKSALAPLPSPLSLRLLVLCRKASSAASSGMRKRRPHPAAAWTDSCRISCAAAAAAAADRRCDCAELNDPSTRRPVRLAQGECAAAVAAEKLAIRCFCVCVCVCYPTDEDKRHRASRRRRTGSARHLMPLLMLMGGFQVSWWVWFSFF